MRDLSRVIRQYCIDVLSEELRLTLLTVALERSKDRGIPLGGRRHWAAVAEACNRYMEEER